MEEPTPSNIDQELLAEIQVYKDKPKRWEDSQTARNYKNIAMGIVFKLVFIYLGFITIAIVFPSILPSFHAELFASFAATTFFSIILAWFDSRTVLLEKESIDNLNFVDYQSKVENDEKAQGLFDQLKQNHEMYRQKLHKEYIYSMRRLGNWTAAMLFIFCDNEIIIVPNLVFVACFCLLIGLSHNIAKLENPNRTDLLEWEKFRAWWRREITLMELMDFPLWP